MARALLLWTGALALLALACRKTEPPSGADAAATSASAASGARVVPEPLPRCRAEARELPIPGEDVVAGEAALFEGGVALGVVRREGGRLVASVVRAPLDLASSSVVDLGAVLGDDPPPVPRVHGGELYVATSARRKESVEAGPGAQGATREVRLSRVDGKGQVHALGTIAQQADESTAFDFAWPREGGAGAPIVAWDEDAPIAVGQFLADRGTVKVQIVGQPDKRTIVPYATDAEHPRLLARPGGFYLAWLARRPEGGEDAGALPPEGPAEVRAFRWVELVKLDASGEREGAIRRITSDKGRAATFELVPGVDGVDVVVVVQDEAAEREGAGARIVRYAVRADGADAAELVDGGVGHAPFELVRGGGASDGGAPGPRWLSWTDGAERAHLAPLGPPITLQAPATVERSLDRARLVAAREGALFALASERGEAGGRVVLRRLACP